MLEGKNKKEVSEDNRKTDTKEAQRLEGAKDDKIGRGDYEDVMMIGKKQQEDKDNKIRNTAKSYMQQRIHDTKKKETLKKEIETKEK